MRTTRVKEHLSVETLRERMHTAPSKAQFQRWQALYLLTAKALRVPEVADVVDVSSQAIYHWVYRYNKEGASALVLQGRGGRRHALLTWEEEEQLLAELREDATQGLLVLSRQVKQKAEEKVGRPVSKDYAYDLLHRHGWRKVAPRPTHPAGNAQDQEAYKKNCQPWWPKPRRAFRPRRSGQ